MLNRRNGHNEWRTSPMYPVGFVAHLAHVSPATVRRWLYGDETLEREMRPVFGKKRKEQKGLAEVSFIQLAEIIIVAQFRRRNIKLQRIRDAHHYARETYHLDYPFARLSLKTDGVHILHEFEKNVVGPTLLSLDSQGQITLPGYVAEAIETFDFEDDLAARWFPMGKIVPIVIDPRYGAGLPTIPQRRITVLNIYRRWRAGQSIRFIASDLRIPQNDTEMALRYWEQVAA